MSNKFEVEKMKEVGMLALRDFVSYSHSYYLKHSDNVILQKIDTDYTAYDELYRDVLAKVLKIKPIHGYNYGYKLTRPFVIHLGNFLTHQGVYDFCVQNKELMYEVMLKLMDRTLWCIMRESFVCKEVNNECDKD